MDTDIGAQHQRGKKRRLVVDKVRAIPNSEFKQQLQNTSDIVGIPASAPATKKAMNFFTYGGVGKFFAHPGREILSNKLAKLFFSHLTMRTEVQNGPDHGKVEPLNSELRTPEYSPSLSIHTGVYHSLGDPVAKRNANSFDYLIKGMHLFRPNLMKFKERRRRPVSVDPLVMHDNEVINRTQQQQHHHQYVSAASVGGGNNNIPIYEIMNMKTEQEMDHSLSTVVLAPEEGMTEDTMLVGYNFDGTNNKAADDMNTEIIPDVSNLKDIKQDDGLVYTIAADQSVVINGKSHGMDDNIDNVLYFITL